MGFYLSILEDDIFRTLERFESNQPYNTTLAIFDKLLLLSKSYYARSHVNRFRGYTVLVTADWFQVTYRFHQQTIMRPFI